MRFNVSSRGIATIATCTLIDNNIVTKTDPHLIIDHHKIEREKTRVMEQLQIEAHVKIKDSKL